MLEIMQAEGTINGYPFYFRSRHSRWSLRVASSQDSNAFDDTAWSIAEDYPLKEGEHEYKRVSAGYASKEECIEFIERHAETFKANLLK